MNENVLVTIEEFESAKKYWADKLSGEIHELCLQYDFKKLNGNKKGSYRLQLDTELSDKINSISKNQDLLTYIVCVAAFKVLLSKYTGCNDILLGSPVYTTTEELYDHNKCIILRDILGNEMTFKELLTAVRKTILDGYKNQHYPMKRALESVETRKLDSLIYKNMILSENIHKKKFLQDIIDSEINDVTISILNSSGIVEISIDYNTDLIRQTTVARILEHFKYILMQVLSDTNIILSEVELCTEEERKQLIFEFNQTSVDRQDKTICKLFEEQVQKTPEEIAIITENEKLTYRQLNEKANQIARILREKGVKPFKGTCSEGAKNTGVVAIMTEYDTDIVVGILGILKAGAAYLPIDPGYPEDRINYMLKDSKAVILLKQGQLKVKTDNEIEILDINDDSIFKRDSSNLEKIHCPKDLAYIIYTSGSTGRPKGVMIEHAGLVNFISWRIRQYGFSPADRTLQLLSISFDGFGTNLYSSLLSGGILVLPGSNCRGDFKYIGQVINDKKVTNMSIVPAMYKAIIESAGKEDLKTIRFIVLAGEKASSELIGTSKDLNPSITLINEYGPTENSITTSSYVGMESETADIIGRPVSNNKVFIIGIDGAKKLMPVGVPGELCVSGDGLARGYINRQELTAEKFVENPFISGEQMYRTGDLVRWLPDGNIEFLRRIDQQVKIRGYRVELSEVEHAIVESELATEVAVVCKKDISGGTCLCAYMVSDKKLSISEVREVLEKRLPEFMVPSKFVQLEKLPLTPNGKVNRKSLEELDHGRNLEAEYMQPSNITEVKLVEIWSEVLKVKKIGVENNFFDIGGNSILLMQVHYELEKIYPDIVTIPDLFAHPTISKLAKFIEDSGLKKNKNVVLKYLSMPSEYLNNANNENNGIKGSSYKFEISSKLYKSIENVSKIENVDIQDILVSMFTYLFAKVTSKQEINIQTVIINNNETVLLSIDVGNFDSFSKYFQFVNRKCRDKDAIKYDIKDILKLNVERNPEEILVVYCVKSLITSNIRLLNIYDIIFEVEEKMDRVSFVCEFNDGRLKEDKVEEIIKLYLKLIDMMLVKY